MLRGNHWGWLDESKKDRQTIGPTPEMTYPHLAGPKVRFQQKGSTRVPPGSTRFCEGCGVVKHRMLLGISPELILGPHLFWAPILHHFFWVPILFGVFTHFCWEYPILDPFFGGHLFVSPGFSPTAIRIWDKARETVGCLSFGAPLWSLCVWSLF